MSASAEKPDNPCACACSQCGQADEREARPGAMSGWRLSLSAAMVFLLPLALAAAGAALCGPGATGQSLGALAGLVAGVLASVIVARLVRRTVKEVA